jgi:hypothetical protein
LTCVDRGLWGGLCRVRWGNRRREIYRLVVYQLSNSKLGEGIEHFIEHSYETELTFL